MRLGIRVFSFISHADLPRLCEEIEILVRIADGVESYSQRYHNDCNYECTRAN